VGSQVTLAELERQHIEAVLSQSNWHQGRAAQTLGISSKTLYRKIREYGLTRPKRGE
jgi:DNA-binding NtrC family response regulator